jgi:DNA-binding response OmpR family regulator
MSKILLVEDDEKLVALVKQRLSREHFLVESTGDGSDALNLMKSFGYDVIILDWAIPGMSGPEVCKAYREWGGCAPIIMLTARSAIEEKEKCYLSGVDDYLTKPFHVKELVLRLRALSGRKVQTDKNKLNYGSLTLDTANGAASCSGNKVPLTASEFSLLEFLMRHPEEAFATEVLIDRVWRSESAVSSRAVRICVFRLRDKLSALPNSPSIETIPGFGYRLNKSSMLAGTSEE